MASQVWQDGNEGCQAAQGTGKGKYGAKEDRGRSNAQHPGAGGGKRKKVVSPEEKAAKSGGQSTGKIQTTAKHPTHVWSWDFVADRTDEGAPWRILSLIDEFTRECISLTVARSLKAHEVLATLKRAIAERGIPGHIRSDNGPEFIAGITRQYLSGNGIKTLYIEPGSPWQNGHVESFHNRLRDRTGAKSTIESTPTAISDSFPQIWLPNTGNKLNKESLVPVRYNAPYSFKTPRHSGDNKLCWE